MLNIVRLNCTCCPTPSHILPPTLLHSLTVVSLSLFLPRSRRLTCALTKEQYAKLSHNPSCCTPFLKILMFLSPPALPQVEETDRALSEERHATQAARAETAALRRELSSVMGQVRRPSLAGAAYHGLGCNGD